MKTITRYDVVCAQYPEHSGDVTPNTEGEYVKYEDIKHLIPVGAQIGNYQEWKLAEKRDGYHIWVSKDIDGTPLFQATFGLTEPQCNCGYYDLGTLLTLKGAK